MREKDVRATYRFLGHRNETEIRLIHPVRTEVQSVFVYNEEEFVKVCRRFDGKYNVYVGINERIPGGTKSVDVINLNAVVFDVDPVRVRGIPSTDAEVKKARKVSDTVAEYLARNKKQPHIAMSGNGFQIWLKMDVTITDTTTGSKLEAALKDVQRHISDKYSTDCVHIDNIGDLARVIKVIGTKSVKGTVAEGRRNRFSKWLKIPSDPKPHAAWGLKLMKIAEKYEVRPTITTMDSYDNSSVDKATKYKILSKLESADMRLYDGNYTGFRSRSEAEYAMLHRMREAGISKQEAWMLMADCKIGKWNGATSQYRALTISKVYASTP